MSESKQTKLPWHVHRRNPLVLQAADGNIALMNLARPSEESEANAAFIVEACNNYSALQSQCSQLAEALRYVDANSGERTIRDKAHAALALLPKEPQS